LAPDFLSFSPTEENQPAMYEMKLMDYGVKPCRILRRHIMSGYLRVLRALEWQMRDSLPVISAEAENYRRQK
jgi:hypothetical protein